MQRGITLGKQFGNWTITSLEDVVHTDFGTTKGHIKLVNQEDMRTILILNDNALRNPLWFTSSINKRQIANKKPLVVIESALRYVDTLGVVK